MHTFRRAATFCFAKMICITPWSQNTPQFGSPPRHGHLTYLFFLPNNGFSWLSYCQIETVGGIVATAGIIVLKKKLCHICYYDEIMNHEITYVTTNDFFFKFFPSSNAISWWKKNDNPCGSFKVEQQCLKSSNQFMTNFVMKVIQCKKASLSFSNKLLLFPTHHHHLKTRTKKIVITKKKL